MVPIRPADPPLILNDFLRSSTAFSCPSGTAPGSKRHVRHQREVGVCFSPQGGPRCARPGCAPAPRCARLRAAGRPRLSPPAAPAAEPPPGFTSLFNGRDFAGWKVPDGDNGHWKVVDGVIDYDAESEATGNKNLWSERSTATSSSGSTGGSRRRPASTELPTVCPTARTSRARTARTSRPRPNADSGIFLRGTTKAQLNIWCWPIGSGEVYGYRIDKKMPPEVRAGVTPKVKADKPVGEWNTFEITMKGDRLTVVLNGKTVIENAQLPGVPAQGTLALQHHGDEDGVTAPLRASSSSATSRSRS